MILKLLLFIAFTLSSAFAILVAFDVTPYLRGPAAYFPDWRWEYNFVNTYPKIWLPILVATLILLLFYKIETQKKWFLKREVRFLPTFAVLSFILQFALMFTNRAGVNGLLSRIINPGVNGYFTTAIQIHSVPEFLKNYNSNVLSFSMHAQGHPPFAILFFYYINELFKATPFLYGYVTNISPSTHLINIIWMSLSLDEKLGALFSTLFIPFLVALITILVYYLSKKLYDTKIALRTLVAFTFIPSVLLFIPINDVFISIFPLGSLLIILKGVETKNKLSIFLSGLIFSVGIYFSISLLPLLLIFVIYIFAKLNFKLDNVLKCSLFFLMGNCLIPLALFVFFKFDSIQMFSILMKGLPENRHYSTWVFYNLYDFFVFTGIPFAIIYAALFYTQTKYLISKQWKKIDVLFASFSLILLLVNFSGVVRGEVARIWLPFVPFYILPLIGFISKKNFSTRQFVLLFALQLLIVLTINEFWVTFW